MSLIHTVWPENINFRGTYKSIFFCWITFINQNISECSFNVEWKFTKHPIANKNEEIGFHWETTRMFI